MSKPLAKMPFTFRKDLKEAVLFCIVTHSGRRSAIWQYVIKYCCNEYKPTTRHLDEALDSFMKMGLIQHEALSQNYVIVG